ncbi:MAG TPA: HTH domain-containing protein, partial [Desulfobulbus sp.]|nr:HTH domain-containing protein [Desulfobulbus sp.]
MRAAESEEIFCLTVIAETPCGRKDYTDFVGLFLNAGSLSHRRFFRSKKKQEQEMDFVCQVPGGIRHQGHAVVEGSGRRQGPGMEVVVTMPGNWYNAIIMNKFDRIYELRTIFQARRYPVSLAELARSLECSESTVKRLIAKLRHELGAPIRYDPKQNGYILEQEDCGPYELPGLWFSVSELQALLTIHELL